MAQELLIGTNLGRSGGWKWEIRLGDVREYGSTRFSFPSLSSEFFFIFFLSLSIYKGVGYITRTSFLQNSSKKCIICSCAIFLYFSLTEIFLMKISHNFPLVELCTLVTHCWMGSFVFSFQSMKKVGQNVLWFLLDLNFQGFLKLFLEHHSYSQ